MVFALSLADTLTDYTTCYAEQMGLGKWEISVAFAPLDDTEAATWADPNYYLAEITYDTAAFERRTDRYVRWIVAHELAHIELWELGELAAKHNPEWGLRLEEQAASRIARWAALRGVCGSPIPVSR